MSDTMTARNLTPGTIIDLAPVARAFDPLADQPGHDDWQYEGATVTDRSTPAEPVGGISAVLIYTDQHNYKVPAGFEIPVLGFDAAMSNGESA